MDNLVFAADLAYPLVYHVAQTAANGIIESIGGDKAIGSWNRLKENLESYRPDGNLEIQRAIHRAYLQATLQVCAVRGEQIGMSVNWCVVCQLLPGILAKATIAGQKAAKIIDPSSLPTPEHAIELYRRIYREKIESSKKWFSSIFSSSEQEPNLNTPEKQWIEKVKNEYIELLTLLDESKLSFPEKPENKALNEILGEAGLLMQPKEAREKEIEISQKLLDRVSQELGRQFGTMPKGFKEFFDENWFNYFCGCFQYLLGKNLNIEIKFRNKLLAGIDVKQVQLIASFDRFGGEVKKRFDSLETLIDVRYQKTLDVVLGLSADVKEIKSLINSAQPFLVLVDKEETQKKILGLFQSEFQRVIDVLSKTIHKESERGIATTIEQSEITQDVFREGLNKLREELGNFLIANQANSDPSVPQPLLHELPIGEHIVGREKECADLLTAMCEDNTARVICFTALGGFGKTALLSKLVLKISDNTQNKIIEPSIQAFLHLDCRGGFNLYKFFSYAGRLIGQEETFEKIYNNPNLSITDKFHQAFATLSHEAGKKVWIALDNFESLLDEGRNVKDKNTLAIISSCFISNHCVHILIASRFAPTFGEEFEEGFLLLDEIGKMLFDGLPEDDCVELLRPEIERKKLKVCDGISDEATITNVLKNFSNKVHRIPMALKWAVPFIRKKRISLQELYYSDGLFEEFDQRNFEAGLKHLHYKQLNFQSPNALLILHLLSRLNRFTPQAVFEHLMSESELLETLAQLEDDNLLNKLATQNLHVQTIGTPSMKNYYALHPIVCENNFFTESLKKDNEGYFTEPDVAAKIILLYERTAQICGQKAHKASRKRIFAHSMVLFESAEILYEYLVIRTKSILFRKCLCRNDNE